MFHNGQDYAESHTFQPPSSTRSTPNVKSLVLVVDDHEDSRILMGHMLESLGLRFISVGSASELLSTLKQTLPAILLLDIMLPDMNGFELFSIIRQEFQTYSGAIIATTALAGNDVQQKIQDTGFDDCLIKPFSIERLQQSLQSHVQGL